MDNRPKVFTALGVLVALILISSVFVLRQHEQKNTAWTRLAQAQFFINQKQWSSAQEILNDIKNDHAGTTVGLFSNYYLADIAMSEGRYDDAAHVLRRCGVARRQKSNKAAGFGRAGFFTRGEKKFCGRRANLSAICRPILIAFLGRREHSWRWAACSY
jgi:hypothetical protein